MAGVERVPEAGDVWEAADGRCGRIEVISAVEDEAAFGGKTVRIQYLDTENSRDRIFEKDLCTFWSRFFFVERRRGEKT